MYFFKSNGNGLDGIFNGFLVMLEFEEHMVFTQWFKPMFLNSYVYLRKKRPENLLLILTDHKVDDNFFWDLNSLLIEASMMFLPNEIKSKPIITLPQNSNKEEFANMMSRLRSGTMLIDSTTFSRLTFKDKDPFYFYCDRLVIHRSGHISLIAGRKF